MAQAILKLDLRDKLKASTDDPQEIKRQIAKLVDDGQIKLKDIERATSYKTPTLSQLLHDKYEGDQSKVLDAVVRWYRYWVARHTIVRTSVVEEIQAVLEMVWRAKEIGMIVSPFGKGKSDAAMLYAAEHPDYARFIELTGASSPMELIEKIGEALGISEVMTGTASNRLHAIIRSLQRDPKVLIIDEADELKPKSLKLLRDIHGDNQERCGVVLIANEKLFRLLQNPDLGYFASRIAIKRRIEDITFAEAKMIADRFAHSLDNGEIKAAWEWSKRHNSIRSLVNLFKMATRIADMKELDEIDSDCLKEAYSWLID